jgi:hypothetical protein
MRSSLVMGTDISTATRSDQARVTAAVAEILTGLTQVAALLPEPQGRPRTGTIGRHAPEGSEPWQGAAAAVYWGIHFGVRRLEDTLRAALGLAPTNRGGSTANTDHALTAIVNACPTIDPKLLRDVRQQVERWANAITQLPDIDLADMWVPVPRQPGALPPACPYCENFTLRMTVRRELVRCFNPACRDHDGRSPVARMERGRLTGDGMLVFGDQTVIHYRGSDANP